MFQPNTDISKQALAQNDVEQTYLFPFLRHWYHFTGPADVAANANFIVREQTRKARIASLLILGVLGIVFPLVVLILLVAPQTFNFTWIALGIIISIPCCLLAIFFNRQRQVSLVGVLLIVAVDSIITSLILGERSGLDPLFLSTFDILAVSELIAASVMTPSSVFWIAGLNALLVLLDINLQPHSMMWMQMIQSPQLIYSLLARSIVLYFVVAVVAYLWVRSESDALKRADRAELIAELERRDAEQKKQLEQAVEDMLAIHIRVANGDLEARAPTYQSNQLWRVGIALNNLLVRFKMALQAERYLQRINWELLQLHTVLEQWRPGQPLRRYPDGQTMIAPLVRDLRRVLNADGTKNPLSLSGIPFTPGPDVGMGNNISMPPTPPSRKPNTPRPGSVAPDDTPQLDWPSSGSGGNNNHTMPPKRNTSWPGI